MNTGRLERDMGNILVSHYPNKDMDSILYPIVGLQNLVWYIMIYNNLLKLKDELKNKPKEKPKLKRVMSILMRRYDYGVDDMEEYRWGDFRDDIAAVKR